MVAGQVVDHPFFFHAVNCEPALAVLGSRDVCAEDDDVEAARRGIVYPFCCEEANGLEGGKVDLLGIYQLAVAL